MGRKLGHHDTSGLHALLDDNRDLAASVVHPQKDLAPAVVLGWLEDEINPHAHAYGVIPGLALGCDDVTAFRVPQVLDLMLCRVSR